MAPPARDKPRLAGAPPRPPRSPPSEVRFPPAWLFGKAVVSEDTLHGSAAAALYLAATSKPSSSTELTEYYKDPSKPLRFVDHRRALFDGSALQRETARRIHCVTATPARLSYNKAAPPDLKPQSPKPP
mmetsp:Transcript_3151/g.5546  ORF Transcript_3151/g.5546 Transcript_3151/m.5546 type:complete len:129 (+) Transcript_3151:272-658(+)